VSVHQPFTRTPAVYAYTVYAYALMNTLIQDACLHCVPGGAARALMRTLILPRPGRTGAGGLGRQTRNKEGPAQAREEEDGDPAEAAAAELRALCDDGAASGGLDLGRGAAAAAVEPGWTRVGPGGLVPADCVEGPTGRQSGVSRPGRSNAEREGGLYPHEGWRPRAGYAPVDTAGVDALRPAGQRGAVAALDRRDRARKARAQRAEVAVGDGARRAAGGGGTGFAPGCRTGRGSGGTGSSYTEAAGHGAAGGTRGSGFSYTEHLRHQAAIKAYLRAQKRKRALGRAV
jgi:hypothetical protein